VKRGAANGVDAAAGRRVVVLGGTSEIAGAIVRELQGRSPREVALVGRDLEGLQRMAEDLARAGCERVLTFELDALDVERHELIIGEAFAALGGADIVILAVGILGERGGLPDEVADALQVLRVNLVGGGSLLIHSAQKLREQGSGTLVVLSSVAGERARAANVVYGASKAGLDALAQGLGDALHDQGIRVLVVRPGFVHTRMTKGLDAAPLSTSPSAVARVTADGLERGAHTVWAPRSLRWLMLVVRILPRPLFRRLRQ
jgi:decaprenylphospho-beta-D-erythro-pentofuranosid-2-ulose 2-reductase